VRSTETPERSEEFWRDFLNGGHFKSTAPVASSS
jgi:hypothetical protein